MNAGMKHIFFAAILCSLSSHAFAELGEPKATLTVLTGHQTKSGSVMAGLRIDLAQGWKTYWRAPGDAGIPPQVTWGGSENIGTIAFHWPTPEVFDQSGMRSIGYHNNVTVPVEIFPTGNGEIRLKGALDIGICEEICIPASFSFDTVIPVGGARNAAITASLLNQPLTAAEAGVGSVTCALAPTSDGMQITAVAALNASPEAEAIIIETADPYVWVSEPVVTRTPTQITATSNLIHANGEAFAVDRSGIRMTVLSQGRAVDIIGCSAP
jgi:DsbC/DsbD-like thiol-disulfide interchange protein